MEFEVSRNYILLLLNPQKGRIKTSDINFRFGLSGAFLMDLYKNGEISVNEKRVIPAISTNGEPLHDRIAAIIQSYSSPKRIGFWVRRLSRGRRQNMLDCLAPFIKNGSVRHEKFYFLGIFPYNRYYMDETTIRDTLVRELREVVISGRAPSDNQRMLLALLKASRSLKVLANDWRERGAIRRKCSELFREDEYTPEASKFVGMVMTAISRALSATEASHSA